MNSKGLMTIAVLCGALGCSSGSDIDIGDGRSGEKLSDYASVWVGYAEAFKFADGSDRIEIVLDDEGHGTLVVGDSSDPAASPATAPAKKDVLAPGFAYTLKGVSLETARLTFGAQRTEAFGPWCSAQTPVQFDPSDAGLFRCYPNFGGQRVDDEGRCFIEPVGQSEIEVDCDVFLCDIPYACECNETACASNELPIEEPRLADAFAFFDLALEDGGDRMVGTLTNSGTGAGTVRLERQ